MKPHSWLDAFKDYHIALPQKPAIQCPRCGAASVEFQYVASHQDRVGYLDGWCLSCNHGVHFSRVKVPEGIEFIDINDIDTIKKTIPDFISDNPNG